jgi:hypothetical protein
MCCALSNDGDDCIVGYVLKRRIARKEHACGECHKPIVKSEQYVYESGVWEGSGTSFKTCEACADVRDHFSCGNGWVYGEVWSQLQEMFFPDMRAGGECMTGLSPRGKAKLFEMYLEWYEQDEHDGAPPPRPYTPNEGAPP